MAARLRNVLVNHKGQESLWSNAPPCFLAPALRSPFSTSVPTAATLKHMKAKKQVHRDAYTLRQIQQRKQANLSRQALLQEQTRKEYGDPVRGMETRFTRSFDSDFFQDPSMTSDAAAIDLGALQDRPDQLPPSTTAPATNTNLDHGISPDELQRSLQFSRILTEPLQTSQENETDRNVDAEERQRWEGRDQTATEAVQRIVSLANGSSMHRTKRNIERIVSTLGRHNTENVLKARTTANVQDDSAPKPMPRAGPDTGSSEVQIGVLTAKIRVLADRNEGESRRDKINKRNLRILVHRRQKLLKYMERKERGSERWTNMIKILGLTPATWKGEISLK